MTVNVFGGKPCIFPFTFNGVTYNGCPTFRDTLDIKIKSLMIIPDSYLNRRWCSTKVDKNGNHMNGNQIFNPEGNFRLDDNYWGVCDRSCPKSG